MPKTIFGDARRTKPAKRAKAPLPSHKPVSPAGPKWLTQAAATTVAGGPGDPPPGFLRGINSRDEWWFYWALARVTGQPKDPRKPPFQGAPDGSWTYQGMIGGGYQLGGANPDFEVPAQRIVIRIQTPRYHIQAGAEKVASDREQKVVLTGQGYTVIDVFSTQYLNDPSGQAACRLARDALQGKQAPDVLNAGTANARPI